MRRSRTQIGAKLPLIVIATHSFCQNYRRMKSSSQRTALSLPLKILLRSIHQLHFVCPGFISKWSCFILLVFGIYFPEDFFLPAETLNQKPHNHLLPQPCIFTEIINTHKAILRVVVLPADLAQQFVGTLLSPAGDLHHVRHIENGSGWHSGMQFS